MDVLSASIDDDKIAWYENLMGEEAMPSIESFTLVNADTDQDIAALSEGEVINLQTLGNPRLSIRANTSPTTVERVTLEIKGPITYRQTERNWPYALFGDYPQEEPVDYIGLTWLVGDYILQATPYLQDKAGTPLKISFQVIKSSMNEPVFSVEVYPVPSTGVVNILQEGKAAGAQMMLLDERGKILLTQPLKGQDQLDLRAFRKGMYYLKVVNQEAVLVKRVVLE